MEINYDEVLCGEPWSITLKGKKYKAEIPTIAQAIAYQKAAEELTKTVKEEPSNNLLIIIKCKKMISIIFTNIPEDIIDSCPANLLSKMGKDVQRLVEESLFPSNGDDSKKKAVGKTS
jgi:hypothetical protein